eukprot:3839653-Rhodomonas_salina.3
MSASSCACVCVWRSLLAERPLAFRGEGAAVCCAFAQHACHSCSSASTHPLLSHARNSCSARPPSRQSAAASRACSTEMGIPPSSSPSRPPLWVSHAKAL